jgi:dTMP kinase
VTANQINLVLTYGMLPIGGVLYALLVTLASRTAGEGTLLASRPLALPIWFNALCFAISALLIAGVTVRRRGGLSTGGSGQGVGADFREGLRFVGEHPIIRSLIGGVMVAAATAGVVISTGEFFADLLNAGPSGFGILVAAVGTGMVIGLLGAAPLSRLVRAELLFPPAIGGAGLALVLTALSADIAVAVFPAAVMGAGAGLVFIVGYTVLQQRADDRIRGRTFGAFNAGVRVAIFGSTVVVPFGIGLIGREARSVVEGSDGTMVVGYPYVFGGIRITLIATGLLTVIGALLTWRVLHSALEAEGNGAGHGVGGSAAVRPQRGLFVAFEGGDGSGKSTQLQLLRDHLERLGHTVIVTREPGGTAIGERIRALLLDPASGEMSDRAEALLYAAARAQHVDEVIEPALASGAIVLCDRFIDSSVVYQGAGRALGEQRIEDLNLWATGQVVADLIVLLDVEVDEGLRRAHGADGHDRLESAGSAFHSLVRAAYRRRARAEPHRYLLLDATEAVELLHARIVADVSTTLAPVVAPVAGGTSAATGPSAQAARER